MSKLEEIARKHLAGCPTDVECNVYGVAAVHAAVLAALREVVEECAKVCEIPEPECCNRPHYNASEHPECCGQPDPRPRYGDECAAAIRKLLEDKP